MAQQQVVVYVFVWGLHGVGKTSIINVLKHGKLIPPNLRVTIGAEFEDVYMNGIILRTWGPGSCCTYRTLTQIYYPRAQSFVFVIDSTNRHDIITIREDLHRMKNEERFQGKPVLILANKQDLSNAMSVDEIREKLALNKLDETVVWHLQGTSAIQNTGIQEGFTWLANHFGTSTISNDSVVAVENHFLCVLL